MLSRILFGFGAVLISTHALAAQRTTVEPQHLYVPTGFSNGDEVLAIVDGVLPDTCYTALPSQASYDPDPGARTIVIKTQIEQREGPCMDMLVPYSHTVRLGKLPSGTYTITTAHRTLSGELRVR